MKVTDEQKEMANLVNLPQFLIAHGFDLKKVGREYVWNEHDSLHIKDNGPGERGQWFRFSENKGGDNIGFLREYMDMSFAEAVEALTGEHIDRSHTPSHTYQPKPVQQTAGEFSLAEADNVRRVFAYLCKTRGLDYDLVSALVRSGVISQEEKTGNVLFKYYSSDGKVIGAEKVGTSTEHKFKGIATGSAGGYGFEVCRGNGSDLLFFESAIDMLSYLQMHEKELDNCRLVSMMGVKPNIVLETMRRYNTTPDHVFLCSDNDTAGNEFADRLMQEYPEMQRIITPDTYKDWNDMLRGIPKEVEQEKKKEADSVAIQTYGNKMWNDATDNRDKSLVTISVNDFPKLQKQLEQSGINYFGYVRGESVIMAVGDKDMEWFRQITGTPDLMPTKSNRPYSPPEKNIFGSAEYRYIPQKEYFTADRDLVLKMAEIMAKRGMQFSGRVYPSGKGTLTVSHADLFAVRNIRDEVVNMRKQFASPDRAEEVGTRSYRANRDTYYYMSKLTPEQFKEVKPFLETGVSYHAVSRDGKVAFALDKENAPAFHRALENAVREVSMLHSMSALGLSTEQTVALSPVVHRLAMEDMQLNLGDFFDQRYDDAQFGEMLSLVNAYLSQSPAERFGEHSKLNDMLEAKSSFDRSIELSDFFSQHDFSDEQRAAITAMFVGDVTRGQIASIDETFTPADIQAYDEILHNALQESDITDFLSAHAKDVTLAEAYATHKDMQLSGSDDELANFRLHYDPEINGGEGGYNLIADRTAEPFIRDMSISVLSDDISFDTFKNFLASHDLSFDRVVDTIVPEKQPTEEEVLFGQADLAMFLASGTLSSDEWEDMAYPLFEDGYLDKHKPNNKAAYGYHLSEPEFYDLAHRYHDGEDIRAELALALMEHKQSDDIEFVFEEGEISNRTFYYAENLRYTLHAEYGGDTVKLSFGGMEREVSYSEIGQAFLDKIQEEYTDIVHFRTMDELAEVLPTFTEDMHSKLIDAFDGAAMHGWEQGDNQAKINRIKKALHEILGDEEQTEKAFAAIAKEKYHVSFEPEKREDSLTFRFGNDHSEWISESGLLSDFVEAHPNMSFALGNAVAEYLDEKQHTERSNPELKAGWYKKTDFMLRAVINGEESGYEGRFDIGDGKGMGGGSLIDHIRDRAEGIIKSDQYPYNQDSYKAEAQHTLDVLVPFLEKHSELTIEEQQILADFKAQNPIRSEAEKKMAHGTFEIYQMKSGEQYHYNRFESLERNKDADLTMADYDLVYSGDLSDYPAEGTLDAIYTKFNVDHPEDFRGHSLSMSDVIVTEVDGEKKAFYCDDIGFTEFPDFFKEKELVQEQAQKPTVADLAVGDIIMFDGSRREVEAISADSIKLRDLDAPDYGGVLLSTSDVYSYDGWQQQMNEKGFEILSKAEKPDLGPVTMRKVGDFYEMYGKNAEIGAEVLGLQMFTKRGEPMVGFPDHIKSEYADKLRDAGYTVLEEQAFELNPPKREEEKLVSLQDVVDVYFGTDCESAETENGTWKLSIAEGDKVGKLFYAGDAVCGIYNRGDHMEIEPYRELTTFPKLLQAAMLEHNPDKPVEIAEFQRVFDTPLDKAKFLINEFCEAEYRDGADFSDLHNVSLAYTTLTDDELPIQVTADLVDHTISYDFDGEVFSVERYDSIEDMIDNALTGLDFTELVSVPESVIEKHIGKDEPEQAVPEEAADIDAPLFSDADVIDQIQKDEHSDVPFWEMPAVEGEQLSLFGDPEPVRSTRTEKPKPEFAAGPIVDGVQVYEALAAEIDRGTGFVNGKLRVQEFYDEQHPTVQQLADFLKKEYGTGGHSGEGKISLVSTDSKGMTFDFSNGEKYRHSWFNVAVMTESRLRDNTYLSAEQKAEMDARKTAKASPSIVEVGERFRHKITGDISEVISLTGALPFYSDDCTITTDKGSYATTENISYDKLLNSGLYEYIGKAEPEKSQQTAETVKEDAPAIATEPEKPEIPAVKNLSQLKKAIQPGMMFEITDHSRPECVGERRIVTGVTTVDFTSKKLDENGEPTGKDLHMDFDRAKNWSFDGGEMTSHLEDGSVLMSFHFIDSLEREKPAPIKAEHTPVYTGEWSILDNKALFREIVAENERFAAMAKEVIGNGRNPADSVKALVDEFGMERTAFLTALNIVAHPGDGRFYPVDKEWACKVLAPYIDVKPDEVISRDPEKQRLFEHMIGGAPLYSIHNTHLAQFAETLIPEYEKYLEQTRSAEKDAAESTLNPVGSKSDENAAPDLFVGDHVEYKGKEYQVENIEQGGFITLCEAGREDMPHIMSRVTFLTDEFLSSGDFTVIAAKTADVPEKSDNFTITDDALGEGGVKAKFRANVDAIRTLKTLEREKRPATAEEKETLSKYVGWGSLAKAFDKNDSKWAAEYQELSALLSPEEYRQARASVNDAFYTSPTIIDGIYEALGNFGFDGGAVLEPAMGIGNFFGRMPAEMQENSQLYGVEIDSISGRIAKALYPDADIAIQGFEKNSFQNGCFDVAVGNVPFGELGFRDTVHDTTKLHDFFFAEALDKLKNGGIMAFVTSAGTLDKRDESTRQMLADKADFIGAIRLPGGKNGAFKDNAGTEVTTDIIFLQKRDSKSVAEMSDIPDWVHIGETADGLPINKYFEQHPDMVLGTVVEGNKLYGSGTMVVAEDGFDLKTALHDAVSKLQATISPEKGREVYAKTSEGVQVQIPSNLRNYSFFMSDDQVFFKKNNAACEFRFDKGTSQHKRFKAFIELRDLTRELIEAMELNKSDSVIADLQAKLNTAYDDFYKKYGLIHSQTNKRYFSEDVSYNLVAGLEKAYDKTKLLEKSDIFTKRTIMPPKAVDHVDTALEALTLSIAEKARVDFEYMSGLTGMTEDELKHELTGEIFKVPHTENGYQTASEYLSGDIRAKLREAEDIAEYDPDFNINVSALKQAMPEPLKAGDIDVKIGATWLDPKYYEQFMYELLQTPAYQRSDSPSARWNKKAIVGVEFSTHANAFHVSNKNSDRSVLATQKYGSHKMNAYDIFEHILNLQEPKVYKTIEVPDGLGDTKEKRVVDVDATRVVQRKADDIRKAFKAWIFKDPQRREAIVERYNELFNSIRPREYDGSALQFPMMNSDIHLHDHQKNAIAHAMFGGNTLFAHCVGAGKTFEMIATAMESKRLGLCTKSLFAVPNHLTEQIGDDFQRLYPGANILVATKKDFQKANRQQLFAKIATGNYDAVIIGHSQLGKIPVSKERQVTTIQSQIDDILQGIEELKKSEGSKFQIKAMERTRKSLQKQLDKLEKVNQDDTLTFEQLGIDRLFVDEAHEFKNLFVATKLQNIAGISNSASQKALDLFLKCRYLDEKTGGRGVTFSTGTPLSNSITELHTMMRYLEYDFLKERGLQHFDNWVAVFGEQRTDWEWNCQEMCSQRTPKICNRQVSGGMVSQPG